MKPFFSGKILAGALLSCAVLSGTAFADEVPFTQTRFDHAIAAGEPTVVYLHATWCPTCRVQKPIVDRLSAEPSLKPVTIFVADFDTETALKRALKITQQSTFVVFKQGHEVARSTGQTQEQAIRATFDKAL
ncbi:thioredoxin family protein [Paraburkholderia sp.]|uniref:thioredoxin family protein n=1 Tax=Paraburkholderia sp. TaxID=1926495 RepID=UPI003D6FB59C